MLFPQQILITRITMRGKFGFLTTSLILCLCAGCAINPITGEDELMLFGEQQDFEIGRKYAPEVEKQMGGRIDNDALQNYMNTVGQKTAAVSHRRSWEYHFTALEHDSLNAFALPGGYIFLTKGMLKELTTEAQLSAILGHEVAHIVARDTAALMSRQIGMDLLLAAAASQTKSQGVVTAAQLATQILGLKFTREDERVADLAGLGYMVRAGYNPNEMVETMQMLERKNTVRPIEFFSTHPSPQNRMTYLRARIEARYRDLPILKDGKDEYCVGILDHLKDE